MRGGYLKQKDIQNSGNWYVYRLRLLYTDQTGKIRKWNNASVVYDEGNQPSLFTADECGPVQPVWSHTAELNLKMHIP